MRCTNVEFDRNCPMKKITEGDVNDSELRGFMHMSLEYLLLTDLDLI